MSNAARRGRGRALVAVILLALTLPLTVVSAGTAHAACSPATDRGVVDSVMLSKNTNLWAWENVIVNVTGHLTPPGCAGDTVSVTVPAGVWVANGTYDVPDAAGESIGTLRITDGTATLTFGTYYETHPGTAFAFWLTAAPSNVFAPSTTHTLQWASASGPVPTTITMAACDNCNENYGRGTKWSNATDNLVGGTIDSGLESAATLTADEVITFTDNAGAGFRFDCSNVRVYRGVERTWGGLDYIEHVTTRATVESCDASTVRVSVTATGVGEHYALTVRGIITEARSEYLDAGTVEQAETVHPVSAAAVVHGAGGVADLPVSMPTAPQVTPTPTPVNDPPAPAPAPTSTPAPSSAPTSTPTPAPTPPRTLPPTPTPPRTLPPTPALTVTRTFQVDRYVPRTARLARVVAGLDDDGLLRFREDRALWGASRWQIITVRLPVNATPAQVRRAINAHTDKHIGDVAVAARLARADTRRGYTIAWELTRGAGPKAPWGRTGAAAQRFVARS